MSAFVMLEEGAVVDKDLKSKLDTITEASQKMMFSWINTSVLMHALVATACTAAFFVVSQFVMEKEPVIGGMAHMLTGSVLGLLLVARIVIGSMRTTEAGAMVVAFNKSCRTIAVLSTFVDETLTISAGAELEKKGVAKFRYELVRLLNLAFYCYQLMLKGKKISEVPSSMFALEGGKIEEGVLAAVGNPTVMVVKWIGSLLEKQRQAQRITSEQVAALSSELSKMLEAYHSAAAMQLAPMPASLSGFTYFFVVLWVYTACPAIAIVELKSNGHDLSGAGMLLGLMYSFALSLFFFGLYEAGNIIEAPLKAVVALVPVDSMGFSLSDDLASLVDDPDGAVPVHLPKPT
jgi:predicted membrane chloride channel (bestrophin family)